MRKRLSDKPRIRRHLNDPIHIRDSTSDNLDERKKLNRSKLPKKRKRLGSKMCYVCQRPIGGRTVFIGNDTYRCYDCYPGSPIWLTSIVGNDPKYKEFKDVFVAALEEQREKRRKNKIKVPIAILAGEKRIKRKRLKVTRIRLGKNKDVDKFVDKRSLIRKKIVKVFNVPSSVVSRTTTKRKRIGGKK